MIKFNVSVKWNALGSKCGVLDIPVVDCFTQSSFGILELKQTSKSEFIGQALGRKTQQVQMVSVDSLNITGLDFLDRCRSNERRSFARRS